MKYSKECMSLVMNVIVQNLKFYDDGFNSVAIANNLTYEDVGEKISGYSTEQIKTCLYILERGRYLDIDSTGVQSPRIKGLTAEGCRVFFEEKN